MHKAKREGIFFMLQSVKVCLNVYLLQNLQFEHIQSQCHKDQCCHLQWKTREILQISAYRENSVRPEWVIVDICRTFERRTVKLSLHVKCSVPFAYIVYHNRLVSYHICVRLHLKFTSPTCRHIHLLIGSAYKLDPSW